MESYCGLDLGSGRKGKFQKGLSRTVITLYVKENIDDKIIRIVREVRSGFWNLDKIRENLTNINGLYHPRTITIEDNGTQGLTIDSLEQKFRNIKRHYTGLRKYKDINLLATEFKNGEWVIPDVFSSLKKELKNYVEGTSKNFDYLMSLSLARTGEENGPKRSYNPIKILGGVFSGFSETYDHGKITRETHPTGIEEYADDEDPGDEEEPFTGIKMTEPF